MVLKIGSSRAIPYASVKKCAEKRETLSALVLSARARTWQTASGRGTMNIDESLQSWSAKARLLNQVEWGGGDKKTGTSQAISY